MAEGFTRGQVRAGETGLSLRSGAAKLEIEMSDAYSTGTVFVKDGTSFPESLAIESEGFLPGWRAVRNLDRNGLARQIEGAKWNFFYLAGGIRTSVIGTRSGNLRRAVKHLVAKQKGEKYNCLEITKIAMRRFLGIPFMQVTAHARHIQKSIYLIAPKNISLRAPVAAVKGLEMDRGEELRHKELLGEQHAELVSSS
jgi:hypothetical protein